MPLLYTLVFLVCVCVCFLCACVLLIVLLYCWFGAKIRAAGEDVLRVSRYDEMSLRWNSHKDALEVLCAQPYIQSALANTLSSELLQCEKVDTGCTVVCTVKEGV